MRWQVHHGDILDVQADALVCSANVYLTMSGGVGGAFLLRYGPAMQDSLSQYLADRGIRHVEQGEVVTMAGCGSPYRAVLLRLPLMDSMNRQSTLFPNSVLMPADRSRHVGAGRGNDRVATGYGRKPIEFTGEAAQTRRRIQFPPVDHALLLDYAQKVMWMITFHEPKTGGGLIDPLINGLAKVVHSLPDKSHSAA